MADSTSTARLVVQAIGLESLNRVKSAFEGVQRAAQAVGRGGDITNQLGLREFVGQIGQATDAVNRLARTGGVDPELKKIGESLRQVQNEAFNLSTGVADVNKQSLSHLVSEIDALAKKGGQLDKLLPDTAAQFRNFGAKAGNDLKTLSDSSGKAASGQDKLKGSLDRTTSSFRGYPIHTQATYQALNKVQSAAIGLSLALDLSQMHFRRALNDLTRLRFTLIPLALGFAAVGLAVGLLVRALKLLEPQIKAMVNAFSAFQNSLFQVTFLLGSVQAGIGLMNAATASALNYGFAIKDTTGALALLAKQGVPNISAVWQATQNLGAATGDLPGAANMVTQAIGFETGNLLALRDAGILVDEKLAKVVDQQDRLTRATTVSDLVMRKFNGAAEQHAKTLTGAWGRVQAAVELLRRTLGAPIVTDVLVPVFNKLANFLDKLGKLTEAFMKSAQWLQVWNHFLDAGRQLAADFGVQTGEAGKKTTSIFLTAIVKTIEAATILLYVLDRLVKAVEAVGRALRFTLPLWKTFWDVLRITSHFAKDVTDRLLGLKNADIGAIATDTAVGLARLGGTLLSFIGDLAARVNFADVTAKFTNFFDELGRLASRNAFDEALRPFTEFAKGLDAWTGDVDGSLETARNDFARNLDEFANSIGIGSAFESAINDLDTILGKIAEPLTNVTNEFRTFYEENSGIMDGISQVFSDLEEAVVKPIDTVQREFRAALEEFARIAAPKDFIQGISSDIGTGFKAFGEQMDAGLKEISRFNVNIPEIFGSIGNAFKRGLRLVFSEDFAAGLERGFTNFIEDPFRVIGDAFIKLPLKLAGIVLDIPGILLKIINPLKWKKLITEDIGKIFGADFLSEEFKTVLSRSFGDLEAILGIIIADTIGRLAIDKLPINKKLKRLFKDTFSGALQGLFVGLSGGIFAPITVPVGIIVGAVTGALIGLGFNVNKVLKTAILDPFLNLIHNLSDLGALIKDVFTGNFRAIPGDLLAIGKDMVKSLLSSLTYMPRVLLEVGKQLLNVGRTVWSMLPKQLQSILAFLPNIVRGALGHVKTVFADFGSRVMPIWDKTWSFIRQQLGRFTALTSIVTRVASSSFGRMSGAVGGIVRGVSTVAGALWSGVKTAWDAVSGFFTDTVPGWFQTIWDKLIAFLNWIPGFSTLWDGIKMAWSAVASFFSDTVPGWFQAIWDKIGSFDALTSTFSAIWSGVKTAWEAVASFFTDTVPGWVQSIWDKAKGFLDWIDRGEFGALWSGIKGVWNAVSLFFTDVVPNWIQIIWDKASDFVNWITAGNLDGVWSGVESAWVGVSSFFTDTVPGWFTNMWTGISSVWTNDIEPWLSGFSGNVLDKIGDLSSTLWNTGKNLIIGLWNGITDNSWGIVGWATGLASSIFDLIATGAATTGGVIKTLWQHGSDLVTGLYNGIADNAGGVVTWAANLVGGIFDVITAGAARFGGVIKALWSIGSDLVTGLMNGIVNNAWGIISWAVNLICGIKDLITGAAGDIGSTLFDIGKALIGGLWNGIKWAWDNILVSGWDAIKSFFGGGSAPSAPSGPPTTYSQCVNMAITPPSTLGLPPMGFATGGIVTRPTKALIGEAGPEAVIPLNKLGSTTTAAKSFVGALMDSDLHAPHGYGRWANGGPVGVLAQSGTHMDYGRHKGGMGWDKINPRGGPPPAGFQYADPYWLIKWWKKLAGGPWANAFAAMGKSPAVAMPDYALQPRVGAGAGSGSIAVTVNVANSVVTNDQAMAALASAISKQIASNVALRLPLTLR